MLTSLLMLQALHGGPKTRTLSGIRSRQKVRAVTEAYVSVSALGARLPHTQHVHRCTPPRTGRPRLLGRGGRLFKLAKPADAIAGWWRSSGGARRSNIMTVSTPLRDCQFNG